MRVSSWVIAEIGGNWLSHANGLHASMIIFECEVAPISLRSGGIRGSSDELQASRMMSTDSDGSQRVAIAHITSARSDDIIVYDDDNATHVTVCRSYQSGAFGVAGVSLLQRDYGH